MPPNRCRAIPTLLALLLPTAAPLPATPHIPTIFEDQNLLAICKPPHVPHHDDPRSDQLGILSLLRRQRRDPTRLYGVHRLDRVTSGILLVAKDPLTAGTLISKFREGGVTKYYCGVSGKKPRKKKQGWVRGRMVLGRRGSYKLVNDGEDGHEKGLGYAVTRFYTAGLGNLELAPVKVEDAADECRIPKTAILFRPHTGKTHQLRVAAKSVGLPILGDDRYGGGRAGFDRTYLHAAAVHFEMTETYNVTLWSPPPFGHLFRSDGATLEDGEDVLLMKEWDTFFVNLMGKYCDCPPILDAMNAVPP